MGCAACFRSASSTHSDVLETTNLCIVDRSICLTMYLHLKHRAIAAGFAEGLGLQYNVSCRRPILTRGRM